MVLVPQENVERLARISNNKTIQTPGTTLSRLDEEMSEILNSNKFMNEREKCRAYLQILQRYLYFVEGAKRNTIASKVFPPKLNTTTTHKITEPIDLEEEDEEGEKNDHMNDSFILETVPPKYRQKAKLLLHHIHVNADNRFVWDKYGVVTIDGVRILGSNIVDLVNEAMRSRKTTNPNGRQHFTTFLHSVKVPREFIGNQDFWVEGANQHTRTASASAHTFQVPEQIRKPSESSIFYSDEGDDISTDSSVNSQKNTWESLSGKKRHLK